MFSSSGQQQNKSAQSQSSQTNDARTRHTVQSRLNRIKKQENEGKDF